MLATSAAVNSSHVPFVNDLSDCHAGQSLKYGVHCKTLHCNCMSSMGFYYKRFSILVCKILKVKGTSGLGCAILGVTSHILIHVVLQVQVSKARHMNSCPASRGEDSTSS